ncbi:MAG: glycosyl transferase [Proteobacteria bacterium]|nr:glycosyl transferase [Pseudomonadota bacterium]
MAAPESIGSGPDWLAAAAIAVAVGVGSLAATGLVTRALRRRRILDHPNPRSSHRQPTPRGGGIGLLAALVPAWLGIALADPAAGPAALVAGLAAAGLALLSWRDDLVGLSPWTRLAAQALAVGVGLLALDPGALVLQGLVPLAADRLLTGLAWLWFVNLFNFMDGIDALAGSEAAAIAAGLVLIAALAPAATGGPAATLLAASLGAAALGFLWWNRPPARVFLGEVGSVPLGYLLGWLLLTAAAGGAWAAALILPLYYLADATLTLAARALSGERLFQAHARHFYQRAVRRGFGHGGVVRAVALADLALIGLAAVSVGRSGTPVLLALAAAALVVAALLAWLAWARPARPTGDEAG